MHYYYLVFLFPSVAFAETDTGDGITPTGWLIIIGIVILLAVITAVGSAMDKAYKEKVISNKLEELLEYIEVSVSDEVKQKIEELVKEHMKEVWGAEKRWKGKFDAKLGDVKHEISQETITRAAKLKLEKEKEDLEIGRSEMLEKLAIEHKEKWEALKEQLKQKISA